MLKNLRLLLRLLDARCFMNPDAAEAQGDTSGVGAGFGDGNTGGANNGGDSDTSLGGFKGLESELGLNTFDADALDALADSIADDGSYVDGWASAQYDFVDYQNKTNIDITENPDGSYSFYAERPGWGVLNDETAYQKGASTVNGGTLSATLASLGLNIQSSITVENVATAAISIALGAPIAAIAPTAKALEVQGVIDAKTSKAIQAAGVVASFMQGAISGIQAFQGIADMKSVGAISDMQAAVLSALNAYSMYSSFTNMQDTLGSLGYTGTTVDMAEFGFSSDGDATYINGEELTGENFNSVTSSYIKYLNSKYNQANTDFEKLAGSIFFNDYLAGGDMFEASISVGGNLLASVGKQINFSKFTQMTMLQNDYIGIALNPGNFLTQFETK